MSASRRPIRWSATERVQHLSDPDAAEGGFDSGGTLWVGSSRVGGRPIALLASEVRVDRGALSAEAAARAAARVKQASRAGEPIVWLVDSDGAKVAEGLPAVEQSAALLAALAEAAGRSVRLAVCHGLAGGVAAYGLALCDLAIGVDGRSFTFVAGPAVVRAAIGQEPTLEALGGTAVQLASGTLAQVVPADPEALAWVGSVLRLDRDLPAISPERQGFDLPEQRRTYPAAFLRDAVVDPGTFMELYPGSGASLSVGLGRIEGRALVLIQSEPMQLGGAIDAQAARKAARVLDLACTLDLPVLTLCDTPGFLPGQDQERAGVLGAGASLIQAYARARSAVPTASVVLRRAVGAGAVLALGSELRAALPGARLVQMGEAAASAAYQGPSVPVAPPVPVVAPAALRSWVAQWLKGAGPLPDPGGLLSSTLE